MGKSMEGGLAVSESVQGGRGWGSPWWGNSMKKGWG